MKDMLGNEIVVGDMVAYPGRQSSALWMNYGMVMECIEGELNPDPPNNSPYWKYVTPPILKVRRRSVFYSNGTAEYGPKMVQTVKLERVIVVPQSQFGFEDRMFFGLDEV